jgi:hypothetical protein
VSEIKPDETGRTGSMYKKEQKRMKRFDLKKRLEERTWKTQYWIGKY